MTDVGPERHVLRANSILNMPGRSFAVMHLLRGPENTPHGGARLLVVVDDEEQKHDVHVGETFPVGTQTWRLDDVQMPEDRRFSATISRIT